jgi:HTH-type transcriptional regulator/antitoxin HigA
MEGQLMSTVTKNRRGAARTYAALIREFPLRPIHDRAELGIATEIMDRLCVLDDPTPDQADYLEVLTGLIEAYERRENVIQWPRGDPCSILRFLLKEHGMSASDLGRLLGQRQLGAAILRGDRKLSKTHIKKLADHFRLDASLFLDDAEVVR